MPSHRGAACVLSLTLLGACGDGRMGGGDSGVHANDGGAGSASDSGVACPADTWDHDGNPATACAARTVCARGERVTDDGSATTNRTCAACTAGTFSATSNAAACAAWTT